jgi:hypothetical protein
MLADRVGECLVPNSETVVESGDVLVVFADKEMHAACSLAAPPESDVLYALLPPQARALR